MEIKDDLVEFLSLQVKLIDFFESSCRLIPQDGTDYCIEFEVFTRFCLEDLKKIVGDFSVVILPSASLRGDPCVLVRVCYRDIPF